MSEPSSNAGALKILRSGADACFRIGGVIGVAWLSNEEGGCVPKIRIGIRGLSLRWPGAVVLVIGAAVAVPAAAFGATQNDQTQFSVTAGSLAFSTAPAMPTLAGVTLNGSAQTTNTTMTNYAVQDATGSGSGWDVTVNGLGGGGNSAVFKQYCPTGGGCGSDPLGYVAGGATLAANSLTSSSTGASFSAQNGSSGTAPTLQCSSACNVDSAAPFKVASAALAAGMGTWGTGSWSATSLALSTPTTLKALANGEVYRVNVLWTLNTGP